MTAPPFFTISMSLLSTFLSKEGSDLRSSINFFASAVSHQSSPLTEYPLSSASIFNMSPPLYITLPNSSASLQAMVVLPTAGQPEITMLNNLLTTILSCYSRHACLSHLVYYFTECKRGYQEPTPQVNLSRESA